MIRTYVTLCCQNANEVRIYLDRFQYQQAFPNCKHGLTLHLCPLVPEIKRESTKQIQLVNIKIKMECAIRGPHKLNSWAVRWV